MKKVFKSQYKIFPITVEPTIGGYFAFTDIVQGAHAEGKTLGEAIDNLQDVIEKHVEVKREHNENMSSIEISDEPRINIPLPMAFK
ncbi:MAG: type II toxin-antitoxin system HicB family antitoxin [Candidatus Yanofskybacteria bacterium]|nr:type II toxin-antitoxin system HicB family antitoxin [Candidatus Yanofskybacteria bacterium]